MNIFNLHNRIIDEYSSYINSFINITDSKLKSFARKIIDSAILWPEPLIQFNPSFKSGGSINDLVKQGMVSQEFSNIFVDDQGNPWNLHKHQVEAIEKGTKEQGFIVTSGTGSGKSLTYITPILDHLFKNPSNGVKAIIVYPLNALINSQEKALQNFSDTYKSRTGKDFENLFAKYTGQESQEVRLGIIENPPAILLTNYMMLELIMVRKGDENLRNSIMKNLKFLVFDELHTYKGRQGADVSLLIRRIKSGCSDKKLVCIGTSATMVSGDNPSLNKQSVAIVASKFFNAKFTEDDIVTETLEYSTNNSNPDVFDLKSVLTGTDTLNGSRNDLKYNSLAIWLENNLAIVNLSRGIPQTLSSITETLHKLTDVEPAQCRKKIIELLMWAEFVNIEGAKSKRNDAILPFRLHQFISQTGYIYSTLEDPSFREITIEPDPTIIKNNEEIPLCPVVFSRYSGIDFTCVRKVYSGDSEGSFLPREFYDIIEPPKKDDLTINNGRTKTKRKLINKDFTDGYIVFDPKGKFWDDERISSLPENWFSVKSGIDVLDPEKELKLPHRIYFNRFGDFSETIPLDIEAWFVPAPLLVDLTSGIIYDDGKTAEHTKLMALGYEGRSTSTTLLTLSLLLTLEQNNEDIRQQKLLSFTDNRQDASLQSGHFNDFIQVIQLRSAIAKAMQVDGSGLRLTELIFKVEEYLNLQEAQYARNPGDPAWPNEQNRKALRNYLALRLIQDLKRGWRVILPNLEQTAQLEIDYDRIDEFVKHETFWENIPLFQSLPFEERRAQVVQILNFFRTNYAIDYELLRYGTRQQVESDLRDLLDDQKLWSLDKNETIDAPNFVTIIPIGKAPREIFIKSAGPNSRLARYLRNEFRKRGLPSPRGQVYIDLITVLLEMLTKGSFLRKEILHGTKGSTTGYQIIANCIRWKKGTGTTVLPDLVNMISVDKVDLRPNLFFQNLYDFDYTSLRKPFLAKEHTGQITKVEDRQLREKQFESGVISAMYCSPTMELGIDISSLNFVHMRNVPPSPANYSQRSGRAGRSGQSAITITYCSNTSPHDRHYFRNKHQMVSGIVQPPRIDLSNEELIKSHLNSFILSFLCADEFHSSVIELVNTSDGDFHLKKSIIEKFNTVINNNLDKIVDGFTQVISSISLDDSGWYSPVWIVSHVKGFTSELESAVERWRKLFLAARKQKQDADEIINDPRIGIDSPIKKQAKRSRFIAEQQMDLLANNQSNSGNRTLSEFYIFRYLASEGFLPGYNFTRLPLRVFLGGREKNEYISRSRFIALNEFGPNNIIYHNGGKFKVNRLTLTDVNMNLQTLTIFKETGYAFRQEEIKGVNQDPVNGNEMKADTIRVFNNILEMGEAQAESQERISCMEEVRSSEGFETGIYLNTPDAFRNAARINLAVDGQTLMTLIYAPSATLIKVNKRWKKSSRDSEGFFIGEKSGFFKQQKDLENPNANDPIHCVKLFTTDTTDILYIQPIKTLGISTEGIITLQYAIEKAIELYYKIEPTEIDSQLMGEGNNPNIMVYEATEGSLGILKELAADTSKLNEIFKKAYTICGFDLETKEDTKPDKPKASYDDLLSYYNQMDHKHIDRHSIKSALELLMICQADNSTSGSYEENYQTLLKGIHPGSDGEKQFVEYIYSNGLRLPEHTNYNMNHEGFFIQPDFVYKSNPQALVFVDGGIHKNLLLKAEDDRKRLILKQAGYDVIVWDVTAEPIAIFISRRKDIFRKVR